jgi:hypothetical protein
MRAAATNHGAECRLWQESEGRGQHQQRAGRQPGGDEIRELRPGGVVGDDEAARVAGVRGEALEQPGPGTCGGQAQELPAARHLFAVPSRQGAGGEHAAGEGEQGHACTCAEQVNDVGQGQPRQRGNRDPGRHVADHRYVALPTEQRDERRGRGDGQQDARHARRPLQQPDHGEDRRGPDQ